MQQNTKEWKLWRHNGIGASDAAAVQNISLYKTAYQLYLEKIQPEPPEEQIDNFIMQLGHVYEDIARAEYELINDTDMPPVCATHKDHKWLLASLDGYNKELNEGVEIKFVGKKSHESAREGHIPDHYYSQIQQQFAVTGAKKIDYVSYYVTPEQRKKREPGDMVVVAMYPDELYIQEYFKQAQELWLRILEKRPPNLSDQDVLSVDSYTEEKESFATAHAALAIAKENFEVAKKRLEKIAVEIDHPKIDLGGVKVTKVVTRGTVDYTKIPHLEDVDLENYRKPERVSYRISVTS